LTKNKLSYLQLGAVHKRRLQSEGKGLSSADKGSSFADVPTLWCKKLRIFRNLWCVYTDKRGWASADIFRTRGVNFSQLCGFFYGRPL